MTASWGQSKRQSLIGETDRPQPLAASAPSSATFRDTAIIAVVTVLGVIGLVAWSGGDAPGASNAVPIPGGSAAPPNAVAETVDPASDEANVAAAQAFIAAMPGPTGGTDEPTDDPQVRRWVFPAGTAWAAVRDSYLGMLQQSGVRSGLDSRAADGSGETYLLTIAGLALPIELEVGESEGRIVLEVRV